ncbi:MAG: hypothetical protein SFU87_18195 [Chitinophagaceae bacterium]|nr:hypothetical protein [Chitinophagaceae bacterium]
MKYFNHFITAVSLAILFQSCGNKLTRSKAEKIISAFYEYPNVEFTEMRLEGTLGMGDGSDESVLRKAVDAGFLSSRRAWGASFYGGNSTAYDFTAKSRPYILQKFQGIVGGGSALVITNCRVFDEITGIKENKQERTAIVEFNCKRKGATPLGEILGIRNGDIVNYSVKLTLYDDGWRIEETAHNLKPRLFSFFTKEGDYIEKD